MKIRILTLIPSSYGGGAERLVLDQLRYYDKDKFEYFVIALRKGNIENQFLKYKNYICFNSNSRFGFGVLKRLNKIIKNKKIDIVHTHLIEADFYIFLSKIFNNFKWISTRHAKDPFRKKVFWRIVNKIMSLKIDKVIVVSNSVKKFIQKYEFIKNDKIKLIYNGIDTQRFKKRNISLRKKFGFSVDNFMVGIVGRIEKGKDHMILIKAIEKLKNTRIKLLIIGEGGLEKKLKEYVNKHKLNDSIIFTGFREDIVDIFNILDLFCLPSKTEGLPLVVIEAMSCELPVICSDIDSHRAVFDNKKDGVFFKVGDIDGLKKAICGFYNNAGLRKKFGKMARKKVLDKFDFKKNLRLIEELYEKVEG